MPSDLQVSNIKDQANANSAITIASDGQITVNQNNPTVTLGNNTTFGSGVSLANATFPAWTTQYTQWYEGVKTASNYENPVGKWATTENYENTVVYVNGVAPTNYDSIIEMYQWTIPMQSGTNTYTGEFGWQMASNGADHATHNFGRQQIFSVSLNPNDIHRYTLMGHGTSGSRFEDILSSGDAWTMQLKNSTSRNIRFLGVSITWGLS